MRFGNYAVPRFPLVAAQVFEVCSFCYGLFWFLIVTLVSEDSKDFIEEGIYLA